MTVAGFRRRWGSSALVVTAWLAAALSAAACGGGDGGDGVVDAGRDSGGLVFDVPIAPPVDVVAEVKPVPADGAGGEAGDATGDGFASIFDQPCADNVDCPSGYCVTTAEGGRCTETCVENCPTGWACANVATPPDVLYLCIPLHPQICHPCLDSDECRNLAGAENLCVAYGEEGWFCGGRCDTDDDCPAGYACRDATVYEGGTARQCVRADDAVCDCTPMSVGKETVCWFENEFGRCEYERVCGADGLSECLVWFASREICNERDDDCDGVTDDNCDGDDIPYPPDNCPADYNPGQEDFEGDNTGDVCDGDDDNDGYRDEDDCNPFDQAIHPNADELCDGKDNDCDGGIDEGLCEDDNACTDDVCDPFGLCQHYFNGIPCDDGDICTEEDRCSGGRCVGGRETNCNDGEPCTGDSCDPLLGCVHHVLEGPCEDGDPCTYGELCVDGTCEGGLPYDCDDNDPCTVDSCGWGGCVHDATNPCDDANPCTTDICEPGTGCLHTPADAAPCDDANPCTTVDQCRQGTCVGSVPQDCDDGDPCTDDVCHPLDGCTHPHNTASCEDGNPCTDREHCAFGFCEGGQPRDCDDGNPCTADACLPATGCYHTADNPCDDANPCTNDTCDPVQGCVYLPSIGGQCNDNNPCTMGDHCEGGQCVFTSGQTCDDGNPCTDDLCNAQQGCYHEANSAPCEDGNPCTAGDYCRNRSCVGGGPNPCDDGDPCTLDSCALPAGCRHTPTNPCDDGNPCTEDLCQSGVGCVYNPTNRPCNDGDACTVNDHCSGGRCVGDTGLACDDGNPCTEDICLSPGGICQNPVRTGACDDANQCTQGDYCYNGQCRAGSLRTCNDGNPCTRDSCDPVQGGCVFDGLPYNGSSCDDDDACTYNDTCGGGSCNPGVSTCAYENNCPGFLWAGTCVDVGTPFCLGVCVY